ncbi:unnamed protein product, partial [Parnassius mnemosyne]
MPITVCCVNSCLAKDIVMFYFPRDKNMQSLWLSYVAPHSPELLQLTSKQLAKKKICIRHFEHQYLDGFTRKYHGYPTLLTEEEIACGVPSQSITDYFDHTYCKRRQGMEEAAPEIIKKPKYSKEYMLVNLDGSQNSKRENTGETSVSDDITMLSKPSTSQESYYISMSPKPSTSQQSYDVPISPKPLTTQHSDKNKCIKLVKSRPRLVTNINNLTPRCRRLYFKCKDMIKRKRLFTSNEDNKQNIAHAEILSNTKSFRKLIEKLDFFPKKFIALQLRFAGKASKGRRYNIDEKLMSIALYKQSPKGYSLLQKLFSLPTKRTLNRVLQNINFGEGINENFFAILKQKIKTWSNAKKLCSIVFDEVQLSAHLNFVASNDEIEGFVKADGPPKFADHALVVMLRGICASWRQPVAYYFCQGTTPAATLKHILKDMVKKVFESGLKPLAFICDQGATSQRALKDLQEETKRHCFQNNIKFDGSILIGASNLSVIYDPPHLIKGLRNNMLNKNLIFEGKLTKWEDIVDVYNYDCKLGNIRMLPKLSDEHVIPEKIKKMKVKNCTQVFSERVAATMQYTATFSQRHDGTQISETTKNTAAAVAFFDQLFDTCNGSRSGRAPGKIRGPVKLNSAHKAFWIEAIKKFKKMHFIPKSSLEKATIKNVPTLNNWVTTLESLIRVSEIMQSEGVSFFYTRNLNQDPLENFFGKIRAYNYRYTNPDTFTFRNSFKSLLMTDMLAIHTKNFNCEDDIGETILNITTLLNEEFASEEQPVSDSNDNRNLSCSSEVNLSGNMVSSIFEEKINVNARSYTSGYIIRKLCQNKC